MVKFKKILFPLDFSAVSVKILPYVTKMARKFDSEIHLLFVARLLEHFTSIYVPHPSVSTFEKELVAGGERKMREFVDEFLAGFSGVHTRVVLGDAAEEIVKYVRENGIELVILGTHGRKGLDRAIFGSVAERVLKTCPVPVLSVNPYAI